MKEHIDSNTFPNLIRFEVEDTGIGISNIDREKLFRPFSQLDNTTTREFGGVGLGLVISKRLIDLLQGNIGVESTQGSGSLFWFTVPLEKQNFNSFTLQKAIGNLYAEKTLFVTAMNNNNNLNIENNNRNQIKSIEDYLKFFGLDYLMVNSLEKTLELLEKNSYFAIIFIDKNFMLEVLNFFPPIKDEQNIILAQQIFSQQLFFKYSIEKINTTKIISETDQNERTSTIKLLHYPISLMAFLDAMNLLQNLKHINNLNGSYFEKWESSSILQSNPNALRVLLVEDNIVNQKVILTQLQRIGIIADVAADGKQGVGAYSQKKYDIILMDCHMPVMDGYEATREIRKREKYSNHYTSIVALTANNIEGTKRRCLEAGMDDYYTKPVCHSNFMEIISKYASGKLSRNANKIYNS